MKKLLFILLVLSSSIVNGQISAARKLLMSDDCSYYDEYSLGFRVYNDSGDDITVTDSTSAAAACYLWFNSGLTNTIYNSYQARTTSDNIGTLLYSYTGGTCSNLGAFYRNRWYFNLNSTLSVGTIIYIDNNGAINKKYQCHP